MYDTNPVLYPDVAVKVATAVAAGKHERRGIHSLRHRYWHGDYRNKVPGITPICDLFNERARMSNNAQIMTMGARVIKVELAENAGLDLAQSRIQRRRAFPTES